ncbi:MAG: Uma2 family endonuclease [Xenococcaceae cyanobacterium]
MVKSSPILPNIVTDTWVKATWSEFLDLSNDTQYAEGRFYYDEGYLRIEMAALGPAHGQDNSIVSTVVVVYAALKNIRIKELTNTSFRKAGVRESQPDIAFYIGKSFQFPPRNNSPVDVNELTAPTLVIEVGSSSFADDIGRKRLLYEKLGVKEYWVVDVENMEIIAFAVANQGSNRITSSQVLPGLAISLVEEALERSQTEDDGAITRWLIATLSQQTDDNT